MSAATVPISEASRKLLKELAARTGQSEIDVLDKALDALELLVGSGENGVVATDAAPNVAMLQALSRVRAIRNGMNPRKDEKDYSREARSGAMYGYGNDDEPRLGRD